MDDRKIHNILKHGLASVLFARGISNHMGSRITENPRVSALILTEAKRRKLYFLDSYVTANSVCPRLAKETNTRFAKRDIFLDNLDEPGYIKLQLFKLKGISEKKGLAIGIGHDR